MLPILLCGIIQALHATPPTSKTTSDSAIQNEILIYINQYRQQHGLRPLAMNNKMVNEAKKHSMDMASHKIPFGHSYFEARINRLHSQIKDSGAGAENVAYNYKNARDVVKNWLLSPGHKRNIDGNYDLTGIGIARDKRGKIYFTQIFLNTHGNTIYASRKPFSSLLRGAPWTRRG